MYKALFGVIIIIIIIIIIIKIIIIIIIIINTIFNYHRSDFHKGPRRSRVSSIYMRYMKRVRCVNGVDHTCIQCRSNELLSHLKLLARSLANMSCIFPKSFSRRVRCHYFDKVGVQQRCTLLHFVSK